jgi:hypothetical protein
MNRSAVALCRFAISIGLGLCCGANSFGQSGLLAYSTYIGGRGSDSIHGVAADAGGNVYVTGFTYSAELPVTAGALQNRHAGRPGTVTSVFELPALADAFVMKLGPSGELLYATYLGGSGHDIGQSIAVDTAGNAFVLGSTDSSDFRQPRARFKPSSDRPGANCLSPS